MNSPWPERLLFLAGALRAGLTLDEALDLLVADIQTDRKSKEKSVVDKDLKWLARDKKILRLFSDPSLHLARAALLLSHDTGAEQARMLETCAKLLREKREFSEKVKTMTTQGRMTAWVVGLSPFGLLASLQIISPEIVAPLFSTRAGLGILSFSSLSISAGLYVVHRMAKIEP